MIRRLLLASGAALLLIQALLAWGYWQAIQPPLVRRAALPLASWPAGTPPITVALLSDMHVAGPDMPPARLARIVAQVNALGPDLVLLAGDYVSYRPVATRHYSPAQAIAPLRGLKAPLGVIAVLGNHDRFGPLEARAALRTLGATVLVNQAVRRGPLIVGGIDMASWREDRLARTLRAMDALGPGPRLILSHAPSLARDLPAPAAAMLAGHTHCGQIVLPLIGAIATHAERRWLPCGRLAINGTPLFVTGGLGTSLVPLRFGAPPDLWLIRLGPAR